MISNYTPIGWKDLPNETTPINSINLNNMDNQIKTNADLLDKIYSVVDDGYPLKIGYELSSSGSPYMVPGMTNCSMIGNLCHVMADVYINTDIQIATISSYGQSASDTLSVLHTNYYPTMPNYVMGYIKPSYLDRTYGEHTGAYWNNKPVMFTLNPGGWIYVHKLDEVIPKGLNIILNYTFIANGRNANPDWN